MDNEKPFDHYVIEKDASQVVEGSPVTFTVKAVDEDGNPVNVAADSTLTYQIQGVETSVAAAADPVADLGLLNGDVTIAAGTSEGTFTLTPSDDNMTEGFEAFKVVLLDANLEAAAETGNVLIKDAPNAGQSFTLTTGVDGAPQFTGGAGDDIYTGVIDVQTSTTASTFTALDNIDGGAGNDVLNLNNISASTKDKTDLSVATIKNIEVINLQSVNNVSANDNSSTAGTDEVDFSTITGLETVNVTKANAALVKAAATTDVNISGAAGLISVRGGKDVMITDAAAANAITVGDATATTGDPAGKITITDSDNSGANAITVTGGTDVTVTTTAKATASGGTTIGNATNGTASGNVVVVQNVISEDASAAITGDNVTVTGGATVNITSNMTNTASKGNNNDITAGAFSVTGDDNTTEVTVKQVAVANDLAGSTTGATKETAVVTFGALKSGEQVFISEGAVAGATDLSFVASKDLTAEQVAAAFGELTNADTQAAGGVMENGYFLNSLDTGWTSAAVSGATVTFTANTTGNKTDLQVTTDDDGTDTNANDDATHAADFKVVVTDGAAGTLVPGQNVTADYGTVAVQDGGTASITTITLDGYDTATLGTTGSLDSLATLNLSNSTGANTLGTAATSLTLNVDGISGATTLDNGSATVETLNLNASGSASSFGLTAAAVKTLNVNASANLTITPTSLAALETLNVEGEGNVTMGDISATTKAVSAAAATGAVSATVDGTKATVATGSGNDTITVDTADLSKNVDLGAGDDRLVLSAATANVPTGSVKGGDGTDTIAMTFTSAQALDGNTNFATAIDSFERLAITDQAVLAADADVTIDMEALGFNYVTLEAGTDDTDDNSANALILDKMASGSTLVLNADQSGTGGNTAQASIKVNVKDAATGAADVFNIVVEKDSSVNAGTVTVNDVETFNIKAVDVFVDSNNDGKDDTNAVHTLKASGNKVTSVVVTGDDLSLDTDSTVLTSVDASAMAGGITYTADGAAAGTEVKGGAGADTLTASGSQDVLLGGAGNDTLTGADLTTLTGGEGQDTFVVNTPGNVNAYSTITDLSSGDVIDLGSAATTKFSAAAIVLAGTAVFQDYANAAANSFGTDADDATWFQYDGNTYIVMSGDATANNDFQNGTDSIIQIMGLVDLGQASFNMTDSTIEIA